MSDAHAATEPAPATPVVLGFGLRLSSFSTSRAGSTAFWSCQAGSSIITNGGGGKPK